MVVERVIGVIERNIEISRMGGRNEFEERPSQAISLCLSPS